MDQIKLLERQQLLQTINVPPTEVTSPRTTNNSESIQVSRRSSISTQNTDTLTPTNFIESQDNHDNLKLIMTIDSVAESQFCGDQEVKTEPIISNTIQGVSSNYTQEINGISRMNETELQADAIIKDNIAENQSQEFQDTTFINENNSTSSQLSTPPLRKISRFLVSPVVEQKSVVSEGKTTIQHEVVERSIVISHQQEAVEVPKTTVIINNTDQASTNVSIEEIDNGVIIIFFLLNKS